MSKRPGWMSVEELTAIRKMATGANSVLEIGAYCGLTTEALLEASRGLVFTVDPLERGETVAPHPHQREWLASLARDYADRMVIIPSRSQDLIWYRPLDVLMVDGDHGLEGCSADLENFGPFVQRGGVLFLDDHLEPYRDVMEAWKRFSLRDDFEALPQVGKLAIFRRTRVTRSVLHDQR